MVIASIIAAFTPLITKKFSSTIFGKGGKVNLTTDCTDKFNEFCTLCDDKRCIRCTLDPNTCAGDQYKDTASCTCKDCKETYGEDCEKCTEKKCLTCPDGQYLDSDNNCQLCSDKFTNCAICTIDKCAVCENNYILNGNDCIADCNTLFGPNCTNCTINACTACKNGYALKNGTCQSCSSLFSNCTACSASTCSACKSGYTLKNGKCEIDCSKFGANCTSCTTSACTACKSGFILKNGACTTCSALFGSNCTACTSDKCMACNSNYTLYNGNCLTDCEIKLTKSTFCTGNDFIGVCTTNNKPLCVTGKNMGNSITLSIPSGVSIINADQNCDTETQKCCWKGHTASLYNCNNDGGSTYSGCERTVCNWDAADYICKNFKAGGKNWRLAKIDEMESWAKYSVGKAKGLQLCDDSPGYSSAWCDRSNSCLGVSPYNNCYASHVWSGSFYYSNVYYYELNEQNWEKYAAEKTSAFSVRCVTEL